jgi:hypothetical protein
MPQTQGGGTQYGIGPGTNLRGPISIKRPPCAANGSITDFVGLFDANGAPVAPSASGGLVIPSANLDPQVIQYKKVTLTAANMLALHGTPITGIAAPGAGKAIQLIDALIYINFNTTAYAAGSVFQIVVGGAAVATTTAALINNGAALIIQPAFPLVGTTNSEGTGNSALTLTASAGEFTTGDSPVNVHLWYAVVTL